MNHWNVELYENKHSYVWQYGQNLLEILNPQKKEIILDLGCGTGQLTAQIAATGAKVVGLDRSPKAIAQCRQNYPQLEFVLGDGAAFSLDFDFDGVFSNAALHWIKPPKAVIDCVYQALKLGGRFVAEFGGKGNIEQIIRAINGVVGGEAENPWYFPSIGEYSSLLEEGGFRVTHASLFDRPTKLEGENGLVNWLEMFASDRFKHLTSVTKQEAMEEIKSLLRPYLYRNGYWWADYCRICVVATKPLETAPRL